MSPETVPETPRPLRTERKDVLPAPEVPITATISPGCTMPVTPERTVFSLGPFFFCGCWKCQIKYQLIEMKNIDVERKKNMR